MGLEQQKGIVVIGSKYFHNLPFRGVVKLTVCHDTVYVYNEVFYVCHNRISPSNYVILYTTNWTLSNIQIQMEESVMLKALLYLYARSFYAPHNLRKPGRANHMLEILFVKSLNFFSLPYSMCPCKLQRFSQPLPKTGISKNRRLPFFPGKVAFCGCKNPSGAVQPQVCFFAQEFLQVLVDKPLGVKYVMQRQRQSPEEMHHVCRRVRENGIAREILCHCLMHAGIPADQKRLDLAFKKHLLRFQ